MRIEVYMNLAQALTADKLSELCGCWLYDSWEDADCGKKEGIAVNFRANKKE